MEKKSWVCTIMIQLVLCIGLYYAINVGQPYRAGIKGQSNESYFISVVGGFRPLKKQTHLLKQMEKVINTYEVGFVINISELGEDDPLSQNATQYFGSSKAPWYTTLARKGEESDYFIKKVNISSGRTLDIIALNTEKIQDSSSGIEVELKLLSRQLELSNSNWHIAAGFHSLFCNQSVEETQANGNDILQQMLQAHGVDAYISGQPCANEARIGGPRLTPISQGSYRRKGISNLFLLHRVSPLEIASYGVGFKGNIVHESTIRQRGRETM
ncbi:calcineurin-like metallo-phosphoesterase superfamily protein [Artemisia annua]|uniref:Calcineurin-like metallo-phosphoesterase superfamily protein n=1 Tax=Artemisia annua TaxID=35608 RepID=A0A2U1LQM8_ARTAN|nr:calcineurin-like metallo-phosphoesterase superfamily protein [Artemisia annua]